MDEALVIAVAVGVAAPDAVGDADARGELLADAVALPEAEGLTAAQMDGGGESSV